MESGAGKGSSIRGSHPLLPMRRIAAAVETGDDGEGVVGLDDEHERGLAFEMWVSVRTL